MGDLFDDDQGVLSDDQLSAVGLRPIRAFVRSDASKNALRVKKHREKAAAEGLGQVNVVAPDEAKAALKAIAKRTAAGEPLQAVLRDLAGLQRPDASAPKVDVSPERPAIQPEADALVVAAAHAPGLRGWLIRRLAGV